MVPPPLPIPWPTKGQLWRDAMVDLVSSLAVSAVAGLSVMIVFVLVWMAVTNRFGTDPATLEQASQQWWIIAPLLVLIQVPLLFFGLRRMRRNRAKGLPSVALFEGPWWPAAGWGVLAGLGLQALGIVYGNLVQRLVGEDAIPQQLEFLNDLSDNLPAAIALCLIIAVLAPVCEEFFFRASIFASARSAGQERTGAILSATLFSLAHLSPLLLPYYVTFGLMMCRLFARNRTLVAPIAAHMATNASACILLLTIGDRV